MQARYMTADEAKKQIARIFQVYPTIRSELQRFDSGNDTLQAWCNMLTGCSPDDVVDVVDEIVSGEREPYGRFEKYDKMVAAIRTEANRRRSDRDERNRVDDKYLSHNAMKIAREENCRFGFAWRESERNALLVRDKKLDQHENQRRLAMLVEWMNHRIDELDWIKETAQG